MPCPLPRYFMHEIFHLNLFLSHKISMHSIKYKGSNIILYIQTPLSLITFDGHRSRKLLTSLPKCLDMAVKKLMDINQESCLHLPNIIKELIFMKIRRAEKACAFIGKVHTKFFLYRRKERLRKQLVRTPSQVRKFCT